LGGPCEQIQDITLIAVSVTTVTKSGVVRFLAAVARCLNWPPRDRAPPLEATNISRIRGLNIAAIQQAALCKPSDVGIIDIKVYECKIAFCRFPALVIIPYFHRVHRFASLPRAARPAKFFCAS
jgi:hypothetical protein